APPRGRHRRVLRRRRLARPRRRAVRRRRRSDGRRADHARDVLPSLAASLLRHERGGRSHAPMNVTLNVTESFVELPALTTAHSHAFQRGMRGAAERPESAGGREDFWSWRGAMYKAALSLDPDSIARISRVAFRDLFAAGVRTVGEFHYVHHQPD